MLWRSMHTFRYLAGMGKELGIKICLSLGGRYLCGFRVV
jgi:hypothetical protein